MRAIEITAGGGLDGLKLVERDDPGRPGPGEVRVQVSASSLNFHDYMVCAGMSPAPQGRIPMSDAGGIVEAVGEGVTDLAPGDAVVSTFFPDWLAGRPPASGFARVPGDGIDGFAQEIVVRPATAFTRAPAGWSAAEAATITTAGLTAWRALVTDGGLKAGDRVLVLGTGGVSVWALQIAKAMGARVAATSSSDAKLETLRQMGADFTINYKAEPKWGRAVHDWSDGEGVDHVIEVGGPGTLAQSFAAVRMGGHIALIGVLTGASGEVPTAALMVRQAKLQGLVVGSRSDQQDMVAAMEATGIRPVIDRTFAFTDLADAFRHEASGAHFGKIAVTW